MIYNKILRKHNPIIFGRPLFEFCDPDYPGFWRVLKSSDSWEITIRRGIILKRYNAKVWFRIKRDDILILLRKLREYFLPKRKPEMYVNNNFNSSKYVILKTRDLVAEKAARPLEERLAECREKIERYKKRLDPNNYNKIAGYKRIVESKTEKLPNSPFYYDIEDCRELLQDAEKNLKKMELERVQA